MKAVRLLLSGQVLSSTTSFTEKDFLILMHSSQRARTSERNTARDSILVVRTTGTLVITTATRERKILTH